MLFQRSVCAAFCVREEQRGVYKEQRGGLGSVVHLVVCNGGGMCLWPAGSGGEGDLCVL